MNQHAQSLSDVVDYVNSILLTSKMTPTHFISKLQDGVLLCQLLNILSPNSIPKYNLNPLNRFAQVIL